MDELQQHPIFITSKLEGRHKPSAEKLYFALLVYAERNGTLDHEAEMLRVTKQLAEAQLRRFKLERTYKKKQIERVITAHINAEEIDAARQIACKFRFSLIGTIGR